MNTIWIIVMLASLLFSFLNGRLDAFTKAIFEGAKSAVEISLFLLGIVSLWLGITKIIEDSGLIHRLSAFFQYFMRRLSEKTNLNLWYSEKPVYFTHSIMLKLTHLSLLGGL